MIPSELQSKFEQANHLVFLTGAGISTPSGIPDYRSKGGLYDRGAAQHPAEYYLSQTCLQTEPAVFYDFVMKNMYFPKARPNVIHEKQAALTRTGRAAIVTQNVDGLYQQAAATNLAEFHGNLYHIYCQKCQQTVSYAAYAHSMYHQQCGGILRPDIVLYGEGIAPTTLQTSLTAVRQADLVVIVGTSMRVYPFSGLLDYRNPTAPVVAINQETLQFDFPVTMITMAAEQFFAELAVDDHD
ncbi:NAD-dependent protein deacylase [Fructilactobacillus florum]|uniref:protein acetyllysine N-acetyltransferase n=1 Tax=Fructilactobacillus florum DSM 22689 = JCM 16035 TaxID=1423745 RepID=A0A0R2CE95_9LACO|nr:NAD-dependent protein deacylase [Fructilactobacillus florum]KRM90049.1 NAD-dependent deacetylase [Fructilactobacillus florum DSM 22689 = JCM 16035]